MTDGTAGVAQVLRTRDFVGWEVVDREGDKVGSVGDLLIDRRGKVRFLDVEHGFPKKHLLVPAEQLEWGEGRFIVAGWSRDRVLALPPYRTDTPLDADVMGEMMRAFPWMYDNEAEHWRAPLAETRIVPLAEAKDFKIGSGQPDLRGWNVFGSDGERVGTVTGLLVDPAALKVRYIDVDLLDDLFRLDDDRHVLVPIELADLKERGNDVWIQEMTARQIADLPAYVGGAVSPAMEEAVGRAAGR